ncbi:PI31 proteasome regulator N-terminal-domain-containing protein [Vararia minispora EC-137]|uniref:PI31 proteasome regulator N-terminal-domain-containing protein n=1 Tax=Vararia minispora EC-137 TaxID=1314806 RepID=A0ACB8QQX8_9AGAM|nr:PI31 proteasome regulator N-terminal-domain-containing protein [Vararia minispora EC-137]
MANDLLDPSALLQSLPRLLPPGNKTLRSPSDAIACLLHTAMIAVGFRLIAVDDTPAITILDGVLPAHWNQHGPEHHTFRYRHEQSSLDFIMKTTKLGGRTLINAIAVESDKAASLDISTDDFTSPSFFPYSVDAESPVPLVHGFVSSNRVADLMDQFKLKIIQKLVPRLNKEGYTELPDEGEPSSVRAAPHRTQPRFARPDPPPAVPDHSFGLPSHVPQPNPLEIGRRDRDPLGIASPFAPPPLFPGSGGDGMYVGPNHPIFGGRGGGVPAPGRGPWGGDGYLPPLGAPPGARFDPIGPSPPFPGHGGGIPRLPGRGNIFGPDNDEFLPPGNDDMYM